MKINYYLSTTTKNATTIALKQVLKNAENDLLDNNIVIVPDTKSIIIERELLSLSKNKALLNVSVYSFVRLLDRIGKIDEEKILTKQSAILLIKNIILENKDKFVCYKKSIKNVNFAEKIYETIQQFKSSNVGVEDLKIQSLANDALSSKLKDLVLIYEEYEKALAGHYFDDCDKLNLLNGFARTSEYIKTSNIFVVGFDNVTNEMVDVLKNFAKSAKSINFSCVFYNNRDDSYIQKNELYKKFRRVAEELKYPYVPLFFDASFTGDFYGVAHNLYSPSSKKLQTKGNIKIYEAPSKENEYRFIADNIVKQIKNGYRFRDFGVLDLEIDKHEELLINIFDEYKINYFINKEINISNHYLVLFLKNVFEVIKTHLNCKSVLKVIKSEFFGCENGDEFENFVYQYGLNYNDFLQKLNKENYNISQELFDLFVKILDKFANFYNLILKNINICKTCNDYIQICHEILKYFDCENKLLEISKFESQNGMLEKAQISLTIYEKIVNNLKIIQNFVGEREMSLNEFLELFDSSFDSLKLNLAPLSIDCVVIQKDTDGFFDLKNLFICGASENNFPSSISDQGILLDDEITKTNLLCGKQIEPTTSQINDRARFSCFEALLEPKEKLFISYCKSELDGTANKPSMIIQKLIKLFGDELKIENYEFDKSFIKENFIYNFSSNVEKFYDKKYSLEKLNDDYSLIKNDIDDNFKNYLSSLNQSELNFEIEGAQKLYLKNGAISATELENYFSCPYKHFADFGLGLKENKVYKLSKMDIGVILHSVVENFVKQIKEYNDLNDTEFDSKIKLLVDFVLDELKVNRKHNKILIKFLLSEATKLAHYLFEEQKVSAFKPKPELLEYKFGDDETGLSIIDGTKIKFVGKIDRIDESGDYIRIIDYKTGNVENDLSAIYYGKKIQLITYLFAMGKLTNKKIAGVLYFPIHCDFASEDSDYEENYKMNGFLIKDIEVLKNMDSSISFDNPSSKFIPVTIKTSKKLIENNIFEISRADSKYLSLKQFENLKDYCKKLCETAIGEFASGYIEPAPFKEKQKSQHIVCDYCPYVSFCGLENSRFANGRLCDEDIKIENFDAEGE